MYLVILCQFIRHLCGRKNKTYLLYNVKLVYFTFPFLSLYTLCLRSLSHSFVAGLLEEILIFIFTGRHVPNDVVLGFLKKAIEEGAANNARGFVVDGFPREKSQGISFERFVGPASVSNQTFAIFDKLIEPTLFMFSEANFQKAPVVLNIIRASVGFKPR